jgi:hypothetical protein
LNPCLSQYAEAGFAILIESRVAVAVGDPGCGVRLEQADKINSPRVIAIARRMILIFVFTFDFLLICLDPLLEIRFDG